MTNNTVGGECDGSSASVACATIDDVKRHALLAVECQATRTEHGAHFVELLWGPVKNAEALRLSGAPAPASSVLLRVDVSQSTLVQVEALIPSHVRCRPDDSAKSLRGRLSSCCWLDSIHVLRKGKGPGFLPLNHTEYAQPRRVSWSVLVRPPYLDDEGDEVCHLFAYTQFGRQTKDFRARPMPLPIFDLGLQLWKVAFPVLSAVSQLHPPTACQMMLYYDLFRGSMGRHRDNFNSSDAVDALVHGEDVLGTAQGHTISADGNSQTPLSDVLVWTSDGSRPMMVHLSFPSRRIPAARPPISPSPPTLHTSSP